MKEYLVTWEINLDAETSVDAAEKALEIQQDKSSIATVFKVLNTKNGETISVDTLDKEISSLTL